MIDVARQWPRDMRREPAGSEVVDRLGSWAEDVAGQMRRVIRDQPELATLGALSLGFYLGWRLRPW